MIDIHDHFRDGNQSYKETILRGLYIAYRAGISRVHDIANTDDPATTKNHAITRIKIADNSGIPVEYGVYLCLTSNEQQIISAIHAHKELFPKIPGFKLFAGKSIGNISVTDEIDQRKVFRTLSDENYLGFIMVHCEKESLMKPNLWDPLKPHTHSLARPKESEIESVGDIINFAIEENFKGHLHIAHISTHKTVMLVNEARQKLKISCGITPHHYMFNTDDYNTVENPLLLKVNPPIRDIDNVILLRRDLKWGLIDLIETDHAPHTYEEKTSHEIKKYLSGFPGLPFYPHFIRYLITKEGFLQNQIDDLTHHKIENIFGINVPKSNRIPDYNLHKEYEVDVYKNIRESQNVN